MPGFAIFLTLAFAAPSAVAPRTATVGELMDSVIKLTNAERSRIGSPALVENERLVLIAQEMAEDLAKRGSLSHTDTKGRDLAKRIDDGGYAWSAIGENIAYGFSTPEAVVQGWIKSPGHYKNLSNSGFTEIGVGVTIDSKGRVYWAQVFGHPR